MGSFTLILLFIIFGFSLIFNQFDRDTEFANHLLNTYNLLYTVFDIDSFNRIETFFFVIIIFLLTVVLLNLLIAIVSNTYNKVQDKVILSDSKVKLGIILEKIALMRAIKAIKNRFFPVDTVEEKCFLFIAEVMDEKTNKEQWEGQVKAMKKNFEHSIAYQTKELKDFFEAKMNTFMEENLKNTFNEEIAKINQRLDKIEDALKLK